MTIEITIQLDMTQMGCWYSYSYALPEFYQVSHNGESGLYKQSRIYNGFSCYDDWNNN